MKKCWINNKTILLTGASSGVGRMLTKRFIFNNGCNVIGIGRDESKFLSLLEELGDKKDKLTYRLFDVSVKDNWTTLIKELEDNNIQVDILINCAGILPKFKRIDKCSSEEIINVMNINYFSTVYSVEALYHHLKKSKSPSIINIASMASLLGIVGTGPYSASKSALKGYTEALIYENKDMYVSLIMPGFIKTDIFRNQNTSIEDDKTISLLALSVDKATNKIYKTILRKKKIAKIGSDTKLAYFFYKLFPNLTLRLIEKILRKSKNKVFNDVFD